MWTKEALHHLIDEKLTNYHTIVVANREPYLHRFKGKQIECMRPASGMATALDPVMRACGGTWIAHGSGNADRRMVDANDHVRVPPENPSYTLRRVWLTKEQEDAYYYGLSNEGLWPLCHVVFTRPTYNPGDWETYREVNSIFADAVLEEAADRPTFVFIQDYHFALLPRMLKEANPNLIVAQFWHIPWPNPEFIRTFPWREELVDGLLGNDLLGFHLRSHCQNFLDTVDRLFETKINHERSDITRGGKVTAVRPFPISIDYDQHSHDAQSEAVDEQMQVFRDTLGLGDQIVGVGIERIDYTKGIPERLRGLDYFFEKYPDYRGRLTFVQVGVPSRSHIEVYKRLEDEIDNLVDHVNWKWSTEDWQPVVFLKQQCNQPQMMALHRIARFAVVSSLHDGLNLVAKEFVASRNDEDGVLILSEFTGAARELTDALIVNPYGVEQIADAIHTAAEMPETERQRRMRRLREAVSGNNVYRWAGKILYALLQFEFPEEAAVASA